MPTDIYRTNEAKSLMVLGDYTKHFSQEAGLGVVVFVDIITSENHDDVNTKNHNVYKCV